MNRVIANLVVITGALLAPLGAAAEPARRPTVVFISGEYEYKSAETLPAFKRFLESSYPLDCLYLQRKEGEDIPGLEALEKADLVVLFVRRMTLPEDQLARVRRYLDAGKPLIGLRTASHAFENWKDFDRDVLGGNYQGHYGNDLVPTVRVVPEAAGHPILRGVAAELIAGGSLYRNTPLPAASSPLLTGTITNQPPEPVAWTHSCRGARIFYTSLGHPKDFENPSFRRLLVNAIYWCLNQPTPEAPAATTDSGPGKTTSAAPQPGPPRRVDVDEFETLWKAGKGVVLDVRTPKEYAAGHIKGAVNLDCLAADFERKLAALDKGRVYLVHCASGRRSVQAGEKMRRLDFKNLIELAPGFRGWEQAGKPVEK